MRWQECARKSVITAVRTDRGHVILAEDSEDFRAVLSDGLVLLGFRVSGFPDGEGALEAALSSDPPYVVLTDLFMPNVSGYQVI